MNAATLVSPLGLALAWAGGAGVRGVRADGVVLTTGYRWPVPAAPAFTVGDVVVLRRGREALLHRPALLRHEVRHAAQWARCGGPPFLPLYLAACAWSLLRAGDAYSANVFERAAGLADGGYVTGRAHPPLIHAGVGRS